MIQLSLNSRIKISHLSWKCLVLYWSINHVVNKSLVPVCFFGYCFSVIICFHSIYCSTYRIEKTNNLITVPGLVVPDSSGCARNNSRRFARIFVLAISYSVHCTYTAVFSVLVYSVQYVQCTRDY